jgi:hypothetical protein
MARYYNGSPDNPPTYIPNDSKTMWERHLETIAVLVEERNRKLAANAARYSNTYKGKRAARKKVFVEVRAGRLTREPCHCGHKKVEGHHRDYSKPLDIVWLCKKHHAEADKLDRATIHTCNV